MGIRSVTSMVSMTASERSLVNFVFLYLCAGSS